MSSSTQLRESLLNSYFSDTDTEEGAEKKQKQTPATTVGLRGASVVLQCPSHSVEGG